MTTVSGLGLSVLVCAALVAFGRRHWARATKMKSALLDSARQPATAGAAKVYGVRDLEGLPAPVQRYFRAVLKDGQPLIATATFELAGTIDLSATGDSRWKSFTSWQRAVVHRPGFLWNGRVVMFPGVAAHVHDSYILGVGTLHAAMLGLFTVAEVQGGGEIARGELMRYLAETVWYPTALLPGGGVHWAAVDDRSATATLEDGSIGVTLLFGFDDAGLITTIHADARGVVAGKEMLMLPWDCTVSDYRRRHGMMVPSRGIVGKGGQPYFVGDITSLEYEFSK